MAAQFASAVNPLCFVVGYRGTALQELGQAVHSDTAPSTRSLIEIAQQPVVLS